jgi:hypothetical protein
MKTSGRHRICTTLLLGSLLIAPSQVFSEAPLPEDQAELKQTLKAIYDDAMSANVEGLTTSHLISSNFTKFGPRNFSRQTAYETNESEASFFTSIKDLKVELKDVKIDVFGDVAVTTFYPHFSFVKDDQLKEGSSRQTFVFLKTDQGWKIIHEHGTPKKCFAE